MLVGQRDAEAVDLQLRDVSKRRVFRQRERAAEARVEFEQLLVGVRVFQAEHRRGVCHRLEPLDGPPADALGRRVGILEFGVRLLELPELTHQRVEFRVGNLRGASRT